MFGGLYLGCPQWTQREWTQSIFPQGTQARDALKHYAQVFNTVEGNTTFYATPSKEVIERWAELLPSSFRLVLKLPQAVTHERLLDQQGFDLTQQFLEYMSPLAERLLYTLIQLPAQFDQRYLDRLYQFLTALPRHDQKGAERRYAVELRAPIFTQGQSVNEFFFNQVNDLLFSTGTERVWMDTRALRSATQPWNEATQVAMQRKPNLKVSPLGLGPAPMVRFVAHPQVEANRPWLKAWALVFATWLQEGRTPFFFAHYPGESKAPQVADLFYQILCQELKNLPARPLWPSERQTSLF